MTENNVQPQPQSEGLLSGDEKTTFLLMWILTLVIGFISPLIFFFVKKEGASEALRAEIKKCLNFMVFASVAYFVSALLCAVVIGLVLLPLVLIYAFVGVVMGIIAAAKNKEFKAWPWAPNWIK